MVQLYGLRKRDGTLLPLLLPPLLPAAALFLLNTSCPSSVSAPISDEAPGPPLNHSRSGLLGASSSASCR